MNNKDIKGKQNHSFLFGTDNKGLEEIIRGIITYNDDISKCYIKKERIINEIASLFQDEKRNDKTIIYPKSIDPSGKSEMRRPDFYFNSGGKITIACANLDESVRKKNNWVNALSVTIKDTEANNR